MHQDCDGWEAKLLGWDASEVGDTEVRESARKAARRLHDEALRYHDRGMARVTTRLSWIGRRFRIDRLEEARSQRALRKDSIS